jgi:hypothetical protein
MMLKSLWDRLTYRIFGYHKWRNPGFSLGSWSLPTDEKLLSHLHKRFTLSIRRRILLSLRPRIIHLNSSRSACYLSWISSVATGCIDTLLRGLLIVNKAGSYSCCTRPSLFYSLMYASVSSAIIAFLFFYFDRLRKIHFLRHPIGILTLWSLIAGYYLLVPIVMHVYIFLLPAIQEL